MRKHEPYKSEVFVDESGKVQFKYQQENNGPCWPGYKQVGTKMKNGKEVPNCVPIDEYNEKVNVQKALKKVKGLTKGQIQALMTMPPPVLTSLINQLGMLVNSVGDSLIVSVYLAPKFLALVYQETLVFLLLKSVVKSQLL